MLVLLSHHVPRNKKNTEPPREKRSLRSTPKNLVHMESQPDDINAEIMLPLIPQTVLLESSTSAAISDFDECVRVLQIPFQVLGENGPVPTTTGTRKRKRILEPAFDFHCTFTECKENSQWKRIKGDTC
ncbi:unnamed protein product [Orchesella dallaii]|uniref:Uncharacterized protein n=1 Tax=Orchesella dallaii TaxID=48710 RepID=A0ABP1RGW9_9HEXA